MDRYLAPAGVDDFARAADPEGLRDAWHDEVTGFLRYVRQRATNDLASPLFYDQLADRSGVPDGTPQGIPWNGFPLRLTKWFGAAGDDALRAAEVVMHKPFFGWFHEDGTSIEAPFRVQDEYCEWHVERDGNAIKRISFTCEPPEYWEFLARHDFDLVHALYKELLHDETIPADELRWPHDVYERDGNGQLQLRYRTGDYNPRNVWNTERGAIHLTHPANSLFAEIYLASDGTLGWPIAPDAQGSVDELELMCCAGRGGINRSSDPLIMRGVFSFARQGLSIALANPIGLYMAPITLAGLLDPDENPIGPAAMSVPRKSSDGSRILRMEIAVPEGAAYTLDQCTYEGMPLQFGGQIARDMTMRLFGVAKKIPGRNARKVRTCPQFCCAHPQHLQFRGTFPFGRFASCADVQADDWQQEAFDIPTLVSPEGLEEGLDMVMMAMESETTESFTPKGRFVSPDAENVVIALEDYDDAE